VKTAIELQGISPFIKCYQGRNIITGAVTGKQPDVLKYLLGFKYRAADEEDSKKVKKMLLSRDDFGNIPLHYAYSLNLPDCRDLLRNYDEDTSIRKKMDLTPNFQGTLPSEMNHN
jgi:hypothetical protein